MATLRALNKSWCAQITPHIRVVHMENGDMHTLANSLRGALFHVERVSIKLLYRNILDMNEEKGKPYKRVSGLCFPVYCHSANGGHEHQGF